MASTEDEILIDDDKLWQKMAEQQQKQYATYFHKDMMDICSFSVLKTRIAVCIFGLPDELSDLETLTHENYKKNQQKKIEEIAQCILKHQKKPNEEKIYISFVLVLGRSKCKKKIHFQECVFKVPGKDGIKFIDKSYRVYRDWSNYLKKNTLPKATICCPVNGEYTMDENFSVEFKDTPSCHVKNDVLFGFDVATTVTGIASCGVSTAALFIPFAGPVIWSALAITTASAAYGAGRSIEHLVDRSKHDQTLSFLNTQARSAWLGATVPIFAIAAGGASAIAAAAQVSKLGITVSQSARVAINVTNGINCAAHGVVVVHDIYGIIESKINDGKFSQLQIFQCIASALFFANAVICAHQARILLQTIPVQESTVGFENTLSKLSKSTYRENGVSLRPTNFVANTNITPIISMLCTWGGLVLKIPPAVANCVENILKYLLKNRKADFATIIVGLLPLLKNLWETMAEQKNKYSYQTQWDDESHSSTSTKQFKKFQNNYKSQTSASNKVKCKENEFNNTKSRENRKDEVNSCYSDIKPQQTHRKGENGYHDDDDDDGQITIFDFKWEGQRELFENALQEILDKENMTLFDVLQISHFFFERIKYEAAQREETFQNALQQAPKLKEEEIEKIFGISGNRSQFFANEVMKSYKDIKLIAMKQDYQRMIKKEGIQVPLYSLPDSPIHLLYYKSTQRDGTKLERFLNVLKKTEVIPSHASYTYFPSEDSCFLELSDQDSKYAMAGVINFAEGSNLTGIIILQLKA